MWTIVNNIVYYLVNKFPNMVDLVNTYLHKVEMTQEKVEMTQEKVEMTQGLYIDPYDSCIDPCRSELSF